MGRKPLVTDAIYYELDRLKKQREKNGSKKRLAAKDALAELRLLKRIGKLPPDIQLPGESAIRKALQELSKPYENPLDAPWSIGSCIKYGIPADFIPYLIEFQKAKELPAPPQLRIVVIIEDVLPKLQITIRDSIWMARLYPVINEVIDIEVPNASLLQRLGYCVIIAAQYAERERISEVLGKDHPDTGDLDLLYFIDRELDLIEGMLKTSEPEYYAKAQQSLEDFTPLTKQTLESVLGKLSRKQVTLFNEWLYTMYLYLVHPLKSLQAKAQLFEKHPDLQPLTERWLESLDTGHPLKDGEK
jgi:hypothetical protein